MNDYNYPITCQGMKQAIEDLRNLVGVIARRQLLAWILEHFGSLVAPWQFPYLPEEPTNDEIDGWIKATCDDEACPCHEALAV